MHRCDADPDPNLTDFAEPAFPNSFFFPPSTKSGCRCEKSLLIVAVVVLLQTLLMQHFPVDVEQVHFERVSGRNCLRTKI